MKCPSCKFIFSDLRDACPRCFADIRDHKRAAGIAPTYPDIPYDELLKRSGLQAPNAAASASTGATSPEENSPRRSLFVKLKSLFKGSSPAHEGAQGTVVPVKSSEPIGNAVMVEPQPGDVAKALLQSLQGSPVIAKRSTDQPLTPPPIELASPIPSAPESARPSKPPAVSVPASSSVATPTATAPTSDNEAKTIPNSTASEKPSAWNIAAPKAEPAEIPPVLTAAAMRTHVGTTITESGDAVPAPERAEALNLFAALKRDIVLNPPADVEVELAAGQFLDLDSREDIALLFQMMRESIEDPDVVRLLEDQAPTSLGSEIKPETLRSTAQLEEVTKTLSMPVALKERVTQLAKSVSRRDREEPRATTPRVFDQRINTAPARFSTRLASFTVDALVSLLCGMSTALLVSFFFPSTGSSRNMLPDLQAFSLGGLALGAGWLALFLYPFVTHIVFRGTLGQQLCDIEKVNAFGAPPSREQSFVDCSLLPLTVLCFGYLPALIGRRPLNEWLAETYTVQR